MNEFFCHLSLHLLESFYHLSVQLLTDQLLKVALHTIVFFCFFSPFNLTLPVPVLKCSRIFCTITAARVHRHALRLGSLCGAVDFVGFCECQLCNLLGLWQRVALTLYPHFQ